MRHAFSKDIKIVKGKEPEDVLADTNYPVSTYVDVSGYEWVNIIVHMGLINASDTPRFEVFEAESTSGSLDTIDATNCRHTFAHDDDDECCSFYIETANLSDDHHFLTVKCTLATNTSYGDVLYFLGGARHKPVTQSSLLPTASQHIFAG